MWHRTCVFASCAIWCPVLHSGPFGAWNIDALYFMLRWTRCRSHKKRIGTHYTELVFLHLVWSTCHVARTGVSGSQNVDVLFLCLGGPGAVYRKSTPGHTELVFFAVGGICGSRSAFGASGAQNIDALFFMLKWARCRSYKKCDRTCDTELVFLHTVWSRCQVVHSGASRARNISTLYFMLRWIWCGSHKKHAGTHYAKLVFLHPMRSTRYVVCGGASGLWNIDVLFFMLNRLQCES
jgi:hypothetical protein